MNLPAGNALAARYAIAQQDAGHHARRDDFAAGEPTGLISERGMKGSFLLNGDMAQRGYFHTSLIIDILCL
jgi:hypothetical protein